MNKIFLLYLGTRGSHLGALVEEGVPDPEQQVAGQTLHKAHQEPVEGDEGHVNGVLLKVGRQPGKLLRHEVLQHPLVCLQPITSHCITGRYS